MTICHLQNRKVCRYPSWKKKKAHNVFVANVIYQTFYFHMYKVLLLAAWEPWNRKERVNKGSEWCILKGTLCHRTPYLKSSFQMWTRLRWNEFTVEVLGTPAPFYFGPSDIFRKSIRSITIIEWSIYLTMHQLPRYLIFRVQSEVAFFTNTRKASKQPAAPCRPKYFISKWRLSSCYNRRVNAILKPIVNENKIMLSLHWPSDP